jgi:hypothetical protein
VPQLTEERRKELSKVAKTIGEEGKVRRIDLPRGLSAPWGVHPASPSVGSHPPFFAV